MRDKKVILPIEARVLSRFIGQLATNKKTSKRTRPRSKLSLRPCE
jgi:hypothetical protein